MSNSSRKSRPRKRTWNVQGFVIEGPYSGFALSPHGSGKWQKKINRLGERLGQFPTAQDGHCAVRSEMLASFTVDGQPSALIVVQQNSSLTERFLEVVLGVEVVDEFVSPPSCPARQEMGIHSSLMQD